MSFDLVILLCHFLCCCPDICCPLCDPRPLPLCRPDVRPRDEAEEVPLHWELLVRPQSRGEGCLDVHEEQQL